MNNFDQIDQIVKKIVKEQELIIGHVAWQEASKVKGIKIIDEKTGQVGVDSNIDDGRVIVDNLVSQYEHFFGLASREVCREAVASLVAELPKDDVPSSLK